VLDGLRAQRGLGPAGQRGSWNRAAEYDRLADAIAEHCDTELLERLVFG
jgi:hypothetical protein